MLTVPKPKSCLAPIDKCETGGVISGDEITMEWDQPCPCGLESVYIHHDIMRYSGKQGVDDDRISCSATTQVNDEACGNTLHEFL